MARAVYIAAAVALALGLALAQLPWRTLWLMWTLESRIMCRKGMSSCNSEWDGTTGHPSRAMVPHFASKLLLRRPAAIVLIGAGDDPGRDLGFWVPLIQSTWTVILVDANPHWCNYLRSKYAGAKSVRIVNALVSPSSSANGTLPLWMFSPKVAEDFPGLSLIHMWMSSSGNRSFVVDIHNLTFGRRVENHGRNFTQGEWNSMLGYLERMDVRTLTPEALLEEVSVPPSDVDVLITDAEGADHDIVTSFLAVPGLAPIFVKFEYKLGTPIPSSKQLLESLYHQHGYTLAILEPFDMLAIQER